jgi:hypothetical protein
VTQSAITPGNPYNLPSFPVDTPSGAKIELQSPDEVDWYNNHRDDYLAHNKFPNVSDLLDLDRLLLLEVMVFRWGLHLSRGLDYLYALVDVRELQRNLREYSAEVRLLKQNMGIDKVSRDRNKGEQLGDYLSTLLDRAKVFGYHRNRQYETAVTLLYELRSLVLTYERCDEQERSELDLSPDSIVEWIRTSVLPAWDEIDQSFRKDQAIWVRQL